MGFEKSLIAHCSPTLASLKIANLFSYSFETEEELMDSVRYWNVQMEKSGICLRVLRKNNQKALIYVCRKLKLERRLKDAQIIKFLSAYGYMEMGFDSVIEHLMERLKISSEFPHEIGIFLGYPLEDVVGFIHNNGKNFQFSGMWKVYGDKETAEKRFRKYKKCTDIYLRLWNNGRSVRKLTVAA